MYEVMTLAAMSSSSSDVATHVKSSRWMAKPSTTGSRIAGASSRMIWRKRASVCASWSLRKVYSKNVESSPAPNSVPPSSPSGRACSYCQSPNCSGVDHALSIMRRMPTSVRETANSAALSRQRRWWGENSVSNITLLILALL